MAKKLVVFYSWSDHTRAVAAYLAEQTGADLLELRVREGEYPSNYAQCVSRAAKYGRRYEPELLNAVPDLRAYGTVFVGSPCWWGTIAHPVRTFLHQNDLTGKTIALFMTHGTSGLRVQEVPALCPDARVVEGLGIYNRYQVSTREPAVSNLGDFRAQADAWLARIGPALRG